MKYITALLFVTLVAAVVISGCTSQPGTNVPSGVGKSSVNSEDQAVQTIDNELNQAVENVDLNSVEEALLQQ